MNFEVLKQMALEAGFSHAAPIDVGSLQLREDVRDMCRSNSCGQYDNRWGCPPGCGSLEECREQVSHYSVGILVQTTGELEDEFDGEGMMDAERLHKEHVEALGAQLLKQYPRRLTLGTGCCTVCRKCTYPDAPCRFPEKQVTSMEAYGLMVLDVCKANGLKYYYGSNTITYTSCFLLE